jgi:hypothetical protein
MEGYILFYPAINTKVGKAIQSNLTHYLQYEEDILTIDLKFMLKLAGAEGDIFLLIVTQM